MTLVRDDETGRRVARIVEVEAYAGPGDRASHARVGRTARNAVMFGPAGIAYVYLVYGMYDCLNVVTGPAGEASALLIRALEPLSGAERMRHDRLARVTSRRRIADPTRDVADATRLARLQVERLASGPGLAAAAFGLDRTWTGRDLCDARSALRLEGPAGTVTAPEISATPRIGVGYAGEPWASLPWRFSIAGHPSVSGPRSPR